MKKIFFLFFLVFLASFVSAQELSLTREFNFDNELSSNFTCVSPINLCSYTSSKFHGTGNPSYLALAYQEVNLTYPFNISITWESTNDQYIDIGFSNTPNETAANIDIWFRLHATSNTFKQKYNGSLQDECTLNSNPAPGGLILNLEVDDNNILYAYIDGILESGCSFNMTTSTKYFYIGTTYWSEQLDNIDIYESITPSLIINHNLVNESNINRNPVNLTFNGTISGTTDLFNCSLYNESNLVETKLNLNLSNLHSFEFNTTNIDNNYTFSISCNQASGVNDTTTKHFYEIDTIINEMVLSTNAVNHSTHAQNTYFPITYNGSDPNFIAINVTWFSTLEVVLQNEFYENPNITSYENITVRLLEDITSNASVRFEMWDSHHILGNELISKAYVSNKMLKYKSLEFYCENVKRMNYIQTDFKISPIPIFNTLSKTHTCYYKAENLKYLGNKHGYKNHYYSLESKTWVDEIELDVKTELIGNNIIKFIYTFEKPINTFKTNSVGDLNYVETTFFYNVISQDSMYLSQILSETQELNEGVNMIGYIILLIAIIILYVFNLLIFRSFWFGILLFSSSLILSSIFYNMNNLLYLVADILIVVIFLDLITWSTSTELGSLTGVLDR